MTYLERESTPARALQVQVAGLARMIGKQENNEKRREREDATAVEW